MTKLVVVDLDNPRVLEMLAELEHNQWSHMINYLLEENMLHLSKCKTVEYRKLANTPYSSLTEGQKESDREWARKVLGVLEKNKFSE